MAIIRKTDGRYIRIAAINNGSVHVEIYKDKAHREEFKTAKAAMPGPDGIFSENDTFILQPKSRGIHLQAYEKKLKTTMGKEDQSLYDAQFALAYSLLKIAPEMNADEFTDD